jgi:hypothetical protein
MLLYATLGTNDLHRAAAFWGPIMAEMGHAPVPGLEQGWAGWGGADYDAGFGLYLCPPFDGQAAHAGNGLTLAFPAQDAAMVRRLYALALEHGGRDEGAPGVRPHYEPEFYAAYARAPDGHKLAFVFHRYNPALDVP